MPPSRRSHLFDAELDGVAFAVHAVEGSYDQHGALLQDARQGAACAGGQGYDGLSIVEVHLLARQKLVDDEADSIGGGRFLAQRGLVPGQHGVPLLVLHLETRRSVGPDSLVAVGGRHGDGGLEVPFQAVAHALVIIGDPVAVPPDVASDVGEAAAQLDLGLQLVGAPGAAVGLIHGALGVLADVEVDAVGVVVPPLHELAAGSLGVIQLPVELRGDVVDPLVLCPQQHVGVEGIVVLQAVAVGAARIGLLVAPDAEGRDAEAHPRLGRLDGGVEFLDEQVHVVASPVVFRHSVAVLGVCGLVGYILTCHRVWVEIVVDVYGVDVVTAHDVAHHALYVLAVLGYAWVEEELVVVLERPPGLSGGDVALRQHLVGVGRDAVRVEPGVKLHAALVCLVDGELQRVPVRARGLAATAGEKLAPGLDVGDVEGVGAGAHLEYDGIDAGLLELVELVGDEALGTLGALVGVTHRTNDVQPGAAELTLWRRLRENGEGNEG